MQKRQSWERQPHPGLVAHGGGLLCTARSSSLAVITPTLFTKCDYWHYEKVVPGRD